jgi:glycosyltransferase involved in cell wall biosynthesis
MKVSVVIPCYNGEKYLWECLTSATNQKFDNIEVIVVNDGSTDRSGDLLDKWNNENTFKIQTIHIENSGSCHARNTGIQASDGDYIQLLDVDDLLLGNKISHQISLINQTGTLPDFVAGSYRKTTGNPSGRISKPYQKNPWFALITSNLGITSSNLFRKQSLNKVGGFNIYQKSSQEYELMFRMMKQEKCEILYDDQIHTIKRIINPDAITGRNVPKNTMRLIDLRVSIREFLSGENYDKGLINACNNEIYLLIRKLYGFDKKAAIEYHEKYIPDYFSPDPGFNISKFKLPRYYSNFYQLLGFEMTEKLYSVARKTKIFST